MVEHELFYHSGSDAWICRCGKFDPPRRSMYFFVEITNLFAQHVLDEYKKGLEK